ncbi:MAG: hypothetical protein NWT02_06440 [Opitutales bacterium]|jgi:hypothetical protein|nr:hypothetical protein [Opitutales bacterium]MDP4644032.1 hypothetical protein [Opitutales bacterium]MDP4777059.1 hypothetical protein [Opitutales bacterium]
MSKIFYIFVFLCVSVQMLSAETWTLESKDGRSIEVDYLYYDGVDLTIQRVGDYRKINLTPDQLSEKSWKNIEKEFSAKAAIELEVTRQTKTSTATEHENHDSYYTTTRKETAKINRFIIELSSSSYFNSKVTIEYFIFVDGEVEYGRIPAELSMRKPFETQVEKTLASTSYKSSFSDYGTFYSSTSGDSSASIGVILHNAEGDEIEDYASSEKLKEHMHSIKQQLRDSYKPPAKPKPSKSAQRIKNNDSFKIE